MQSMTTHERVSRMFTHQDADRIPITDGPWEATFERWHAEGMPRDVSFADYFDLDKFAMIGVDNSPQYEKRTISETDTHKTYTSEWGVTMRQQKPSASTPEFLDFTIKDPDSWRIAKARMNTDPSRIDWKHLEGNFPKWKKEGWWIQAFLWFGFDITHSWIAGTERMLMAMLENPEWCREMYQTELDISLALYDKIWEKGHHFDSVFWCDDMGYKHNQFFSLDTYREVLKPIHQQAIDWAHKKGIKAHLHSCGDVNPFVQELIGMGLDALNPLEVKAGMNPLELKKDFGDKLLFHGGINAVLWDNPDAIIAEMERVVPVMKNAGGYIFSTDHSVPSNVSLKDFKRIIGKAKDLGRY
jgi:uroporphyrinogen decarboxylase